MVERLLCVEVTLHETDPVREELVEELLWTRPIHGVERQDDETWSALVEEPRPRAAGAVRWRVHLADVDDPDAAARAFEDVLAEVPGLSLDHWIIDDLSFLTRWREYFRPARISPRIVVHPPWDVPEVEAGVVRVEIEPGMAFGTGTHETTRLCLRVIDDLIGEDQPRVFDVGCGSGVLAIAAAKLGAAEVIAVDNDPEAVAIARENVAINRCADVVATSTTATADVPTTFPIVVANILPHILESLRDALWAHVSPGGALVLSGILLTEAPRMRQVFDREGAAFVEQRDDGEWCALVWRDDGGP